MFRQEGGGTPWTPYPPPLDPPPPSPPWDIGVRTPAQLAKRPRLQTPLHMSLVKVPRPPGEAATPATPSGAVTPYYLGPARNTFESPQIQSPMPQQVSQQLLESLNLVLMADDSDQSVNYDTPRSVATHVSTATTVTCSTDGSQCATP